MKNFNNKTIELLNKLVSIPSFVDEKNNELLIGEYLESYLKGKVPLLKLKKQYIEKNKRFNLFCYGKRPEILVLAHLDTVQPQSGWITNPLTPTVKNQKFYGLGAADMKGSIASFLASLLNTKLEIDLEKLAILFYIDEEYDFLGMKEFIKNKLSIKPKTVLSLDGELCLTSGCRGLIELSLVFKGKSGASCNPNNGVNAVTKSLAIFNELNKKLFTYKDPYLGPTTSNLAFIRGGTTQDNGLTLQREGNVIPDFAELTLEVRPSVIEVTSKFIIKLLKKYATKQGLRIEGIKIRHSIPSWAPSYNSTETKKFKELYKKAGVYFTKSKEKYSGYVDIQMLSKVLNVPMFVIGTGGENYHGPNECVPLENLEKAQKIYEQVLKEYCRKDTNEN